MPGMSHSDTPDQSRGGNGQRTFFIFRLGTGTTLHYYSVAAQPVQLTKRTGAHPWYRRGEIEMGSTSILNAIEQIEPGVVILNRDRSISHINRMFMLLFSDISLKKLFQGDILEFHRPESRDRVRETLRLVVEAKRQIPTTLRFIRNDDKDRYLLIKLIPLVDSDMAEERISALFYDITPYITTEQKLVRVPVSSHGEIHLLHPHEIVYFKADNIYTTVRTNSSEYHCALSLGAVEKRLSQEMFHRVHRSYLVNIERVHKILRDPNECTVDVADGEVHIPISRDKMQDFLAIVGLK